MAVPFHNQVKTHGFHQELFHLTFNITGLPGTYNEQELVGRALAVDATTPNSLKLAGDGDAVVARLASFENRASQAEGIVGAAEFRFAMRMPVAEGETLAVGDTVVGAGAGFVRARNDGGTPTPAPAPDYNQNFVTEVSADGAYATVVKF